MNAVCLVIDRLHAGYLGAYGNTWVETPAFDRLAGESFVFDQALIDTPRLDLLYRSYWQGLHALSRGIEGRPSLPGLLREAGVTTALLTDERLVHEHPLAVEFDDIITIDPPWQMQMAGEGAFEETHLARCFLQIIDWLQSAPRPFMLWCHLGSLGTVWDAPLDFRAQYCEEGDPEPLQSAEVPDRMLPERFDPDELLGFVQAYAGQVSLLDTCLGGLWEALQEYKGGHETLLALTSSRGFPLGEHRRLGPCDEALYAELVHVPLMLRFPDGLGATARSQALVEPSDFWATLLDCWRIAGAPSCPSGMTLMPFVREEGTRSETGPNSRSETGPNLCQVRDRLVVAGRGAELGIRTPAWYLRKVAQPELFVKPDDHWEVNNVAVRCQEVVECLGDAAIEYEQTVAAGQISDLPELRDVLVQGLE